jgi:hypothetical protein
MSNAKRDNNQQDANDDSVRFEGRIFHLDPVSKIYTTESSTKDQNRTEENYRVSPVLPLGVFIKRDWFAFIVNLIISIGTFIIIATYTYYAGGQWTEMRKAANASVDASRTAACALVENREQFQKSFSLNREALTSVQRAYVSFRGTIGSDRIVEHGRTVKLKLSVPWDNNGSTRTKYAEGMINWHTFPIFPGAPGVPRNYSFPDQGQAEKRQFDIPPKGTAIATAEVAVNWFEATQVHNCRMFVWGWITYHDVFNATPPRLSEFCDEVVNIRNDKDFTDPSVNITWDLELCRTHNCSDDECADYEQRTAGK